MSSDIRFLLSLSILIPVAMSLLRLKYIPAIYYPIITTIMLGLLNEVLVFIFFERHPVLNNIYFLLEFVLLCFQFKNWKHVLNRKIAFLLLTATATALWIIDNVLLGKIFTYSSLLNIFFPFIIVLLATRQLSFIVAFGKTNITRNPVFVFCISMIFFYSYRVLSETFYHYAPTGDIQRSIFSIQTYVNVIFNILLGVAILLIRRKGAFSGLSNQTPLK